MAFVGETGTCIALQSSLVSFLLQHPPSQSTALLFPTTYCCFPFDLLLATPLPASHEFHRHRHCPPATATVSVTITSLRACWFTHSPLPAVIPPFLRNSSTCLETASLHSFSCALSHPSFFFQLFMIIACFSRPTGHVTLSNLTCPASSHGVALKLISNNRTTPPFSVPQQPTFTYLLHRIGA